MTKQRQLPATVMRAILAIAFLLLTTVLVLVVRVPPATAAVPTNNFFPIAGFTRASSGCVDNFSPGGHEGTDCFAPLSTPLIAAEPGWIYYTRSQSSVWQCPSGPGDKSGHRISLLGNSGTRYYYGHLDRFTSAFPAGIEFEEGDRVSVAKGQLVGFVGETGNARCSVPHLHIQIWDDGVLVNPYPLMGTWTAANPIGDPPPAKKFGLAGGPAVRYNTTLQFYGVGNNADANLLQLVFVPGEGWRDWTNLGGGLLGTPSVVMYNDNLNVYARGANNMLYQRGFVPGEGWRPWLNLGGPIASDPVAIVHNDNLNVFARNSDGNVVYRPYAAGQGWRDWVNLGGNVVGTPSVVNYNTNLNVYARNANNALLQRGFVIGEGWKPWLNLGGVITSDPAAIAYRGNLNVYARGANNALLQRGYVPGEGWKPWLNLGGVITSDPVPIVYRGNLNVYAHGANNALYQRGYVSGEGWKPWLNLGGNLR